MLWKWCYVFLRGIIIYRKLISRSLRGMLLLYSWREYFLYYYLLIFKAHLVLKAQETSWYHKSLIGIFLAFIILCSCHVTFLLKVTILKSLYALIRIIFLWRISLILLLIYNWPQLSSAFVNVSSWFCLIQIRKQILLYI